jgi:two-component system cell cycle sensor histidine kinase/response regulator CckA
MDGQGHRRTGLRVDRGAGRRMISWRGVMLLASGSFYPLWYLLAPQPSMNPWWWWWLAGGGFAACGLLNIVRPELERVAQLLANFCCGLVTLQLFVLASANDMHPFYAVGSTMAIMACALFFAKRRDLIVYGLYVGLLFVAFLVADPDPRKVAYWGGALPVLAFAYQRLDAQVVTERVERGYRVRLQAEVAARTEDLSQANQRLQEEIRQREWLENEIRVSQKMEAIGQMAGGIAHDFNNVITTIGVYAELILGNLPDDSSVRGDVHQIQESSQEAASLVRHLLSFSRPDSVETAVLDLSDVVADMAELLRHVLGESASLSLQLAEEPMNIEGNRDQIHQILLNLVINARDAMPNGGKLLIEVGDDDGKAVLLPEGRDVSKGPGYVFVAVSDTGHGMTEEVRSRVFDPFFTTKDAQRGTGLGLSTVYGIVRQNGGHVRALSEPGEGSRFELFWPRASRAIAPPAPSSARAVPAGSGERILLVEDEQHLRSALHSVLTRTGYHVVEVSDARLALDEVSRNGERPFDLVVSDIVMPQMSGIELVAQLKRRQPDLRVLLVSGHRSHPSLRDLDLPPGAAFLAKPFTLGELTAKVRDLLTLKAS